MVFNEHVKIREERFGAVIFETLSEKVFITNEQGKEILNLLQEGHSETKIVDILADSYDVQPTDIREDVLGFIGLLKERGIVD